MLVSVSIQSHQSQQRQGCAYGLVGDGDSEPLDHDCCFPQKNETKVLLRDEIYIRFGLQLLWMVMVLSSVNCHYLGALSLWLFDMGVWYEEFMSIFC